MNIKTRLLRAASSMALAALPLAGACSQSSPAAPSLPPATHSGPIAISRDGARIYVVHPEADSVTAVDTGSASLAPVTFALAASPPTLDDEGNYYPSVMPRALALDPTGQTLFVTGQRSGHVYAFDTSSGAKLADTQACAEPIGVVVDGAGANVYVACSQDDTIVQLSASHLSVVATVASPHKPWALAWASDGKTLLSTHLLGWGDAASAHPPSAGASSPGVTAFATGPLSMNGTWTVADGPAGALSDRASRAIRGVYDAMVRPGTSDLWVLHVMLGMDTAEPDLDFQNTVFPTVSLLDGTGAASSRLTVSTSPGDGGAFSDIVSGPRAITFSPDGLFAFIVDAASEDILVVDARLEVEAALVRPLPGHQPEGAVWGLGGKLYVQERNTEDLAVVDVTESAAGVTAVVEPSVIPTLAADPMPANLRLGQHLFNSANSDEYPITSNHWASCTTCHLEGRSDAVTWRFGQGPRDTPSNAGGVLHTGFLLRTADRNSVVDYWQTIDAEQGGDFNADQASQLPLLQAIMHYVNHAIPYPVPPTADAATVALEQQGATIFHQSHCDNCHAGTWMTDSGAGNATLDLAGPVSDVEAVGGVLLHDVGTCVTAPFADQPHATINGYPRAACNFDTPTLRGLSDSAPYLHDGSAATLEDAVNIMMQGVDRNGGVHNDPAGRDVPLQLSASDMQALVAYLRSE